MHLGTSHTRCPLSSPYRKRVAVSEALAERLLYPRLVPLGGLGPLVPPSAVAVAAATQQRPAGASEAAGSVQRPDTLPRILHRGCGAWSALRPCVFCSHSGSGPLLGQAVPHSRARGVTQDIF